MRAACSPWQPALPWPAGAAAAQKVRAETGEGEHGVVIHPQGPLHPLSRAAPSSYVPSLQSSCPPAPGADDYALDSGALLSSPPSPAPASAPGRHQGWTWAEVGGWMVPWRQESRRAGGGHCWRDAVYAGVVGAQGVLTAGVPILAALPLSTCCQTPLRSRNPSPGHSPWGLPRLYFWVPPQLPFPLLPRHRRRSPLPPCLKP